MVYMFNELSLTEVNSKQLVRQVLEDFVKSFVRAREIGLTEMRLHEDSLQNLFQIKLSQNYNIDNWLNDSEKNDQNEYIVSRDYQIRFREIFTTFPLITEAEVNENEFYKRSDFKKELNNVTYSSWGLGAAFIYKTLSISLGTNLEWEKENIELSHYFLTLDGDDRTENINVGHFSNVSILKTHEPWLQQLQIDSLKKSEELWLKRLTFFPNLILCDEIERQLQRLGVSKMLLQIIERLKALDTYVSKWNSGDFNWQDCKKNINCDLSPESPTTISKYGHLRKFTIPNQGKKLFDLHIKTGDLRFHFYPDNANRKVYIGYIGKHLPLA